MSALRNGLVKGKIFFDTKVCIKLFFQFDKRVFDILKYYQKYKVCAVPQKKVHAEHREMLQKIKDRDKEGMKELVIRHLANLIDFAKMSAKGDIPEFEYGHI